MNQHAKIETAVPTGISPEEWQARTDLAAVYRLCAHYGWDDLIYNHCSMRVPGEPSKFLMKQHELLWTEVTASNLRKVDMNDDLDEKPASTGRASPCTAACSRAGPTSIARSMSTPRPAWRSPASSADCAWCRSRRSASTTASAITPTRASPRISSERARINRDARPEPRADHAQPRPADRRQERARGLRPDEDADRGGHHPAQDGGDRRRADRNSPRRFARSAAAQYQNHDAGRGSADWPAYPADRWTRSIRATGTRGSWRGCGGTSVAAPSYVRLGGPRRSPLRCRSNAAPPLDRVRP